MKKYRAVFKMEFEAKDWKSATEIFEERLKGINEYMSWYHVQGKSLKEIDGDFE
jgi:hypothetical protein